MWTKTKNYIRSYRAGSVIKRLIVILLSILLMDFGISCYFNCGLGADPFSVFVDGEHYLTGLDYGQITNINNVVLFILMLIFCRKYIHVGTIVSAAISGTLLNVVNNWLKVTWIADQPWEQWLMLMLGVVGFAASVALYIVADMGLSTVAAISVYLEEKTKINIRWLRIGQDVFFTLLGVLLGAIAGHVVFSLNPDLHPLTGLGTIIGAFGTGPIMKWCINWMIGPLRKWFGPLRKTETAEKANEHP